MMGMAPPPSDCPPPAEIERSLEASRHEGASCQVAFCAFDYYIVPFALFLGATTQKIGWLIALPSLLSAVSQFFVLDVLRAFGNRRALLLWGVALQAAVLVPLSALGLARIPSRVAALFVLVCAFRTIGALMGPPWGSLMSDYLPERRRGAYFGGRSQVVGVCGILTAAAGGALLHFLEPVSEGAAFAALFGAAGFFRALSFFYMRRQVNMPEHHSPRESFDLLAVRRKLRDSNLARFIAYIAAMTFAAQLSAAYFGVHLLRDLKFDYMRYTSVQLASAVSSFATFPLWGRHADLVGNARVVRLNGLLLPLVPLLWCATDSAAGLCVVEAFGGFLWSGFSLCTTNFVYDAVPPEKRVRALGWFNLINGSAVFTGALLGGVLADRLPAIGRHQLHTLFLVAAAARFAADFLLRGHFQEARSETRHADHTELFFSVVGLRPLSGDNRDLEWEPPAEEEERGRS
jgi:MFS family permease